MYPGLPREFLQVETWALGGQTWTHGQRSVQGSAAFVKWPVLSMLCSVGQVPLAQTDASGIGTW